MTINQQESTVPIPTPSTPTIAPAGGTLGVLIVGLGAVATTLITGVELANATWPHPLARSPRRPPSDSANAPTTALR